MRKSLLLSLILALALFACRKDDVEEQQLIDCGGLSDTSNVTIVLEDLPYPNLSDYNFFQGNMANMEPRNAVIPYDIRSHLFTDYAKKNRYIWMPEGVSASYVGDGEVLEFPVGTVIIKTFYYDRVQPADQRRIMETRLLIRQEAGWQFAEYVWNDDQMEAELDLQGSFAEIQFIDENEIVRDLNYRIPSETECQTCHNISEFSIPIGPKPQGLNMTISYATGAMNQLDKWEGLGYLSGNRPSNSEIVTVVDYADVTQDLQLRVRSYLDINCSHCHSDGAYCDYRPMRFAFDETGNPDNLGICIPPDDQSLGINQDFIVSAGAPENSMLYYRFSSNDESERMPLTGRTVVDEPAVAMMQEWILSLTPPCD